MQTETAQRHKRIKALLKTECLTLSEIGRRVGLTRERVRQIANQEGTTGAVRHGECAKRRHLEALLSGPLGRLIAQLEAHKLAWSPVVFFKQGRPRGYSTTRLVVENLRTARYRASTGSRGYVELRPVNSQTDIGAYLLSDGRWLLLPRDVTTAKAKTEFSLHEPNNRQGMGASKQHDYRDYIEKWDVFKEKQ